MVLKYKYIKLIYSIKICEYLPLPSRQSPTSLTWHTIDCKFTLLFLQHCFLPFLISFVCHSPATLNDLQLNACHSSTSLLFPLFEMLFSHPLPSYCQPDGQLLLFTTQVLPNQEGLLRLFDSLSVVMARHTQIV